MIKVYGIKNCDTVKKSLQALDKLKVKYEFVDLKKEPPTPELLRSWKSELGEFPVNRAGRTYKQNQEQYEAANVAGKIELLCEKSSMIKRPLVTKNSKIIALGFDLEAFKSI
jgi:arsenate reductase (glutaredoxin)